MSPATAWIVLALGLVATLAIIAVSCVITGRDLPDPPTPARDKLWLDRDDWIDP